MAADTAHIASLISSHAWELGFELFGIATVQSLEKEYEKVDHWTAQGYQGEMQWMERNREKRKNPASLFTGARSVLVAGMNYYTSQNHTNPAISSYALGADYHKVLKDKLYELLNYIRVHFPEVRGRAFVDSAPVLEKAWAVRAGLGWQGKNTLLINKELGSYLFLGELILDVDLPGDPPTTASYCGSCRKCIDACPTAALSEEGVLDSRKCISYLTIEKKGEFPEEYRGKTEGYIFGCDICQQVCPWNQKAREHRVADFLPKAGLMDMRTADWLSLSEEEFEERFSDSPLARPGLTGIQRNVRFLGTRN